MEVIKKYNSEESRQRRDKYLQDIVAPYVLKSFEKFPKIKSATLFVAQYWNDEAQDAVHEALVYSIYETPDIETWVAKMKGFEDDEIELEIHYSLFEGWDAIYETDMEVSDYGTPKINNRNSVAAWNSNGAPISLFAAYCEEGGNQENEFPLDYRPIAIYRRNGNCEFCGLMIRPWLDGVMPEREQNES